MWLWMIEAVFFSLQPMDYSLTTSIQASPLQVAFVKHLTEKQMKHAHGQKGFPCAIHRLNPLKGRDNRRQKERVSETASFISLPLSVSSLHLGLVESDSMRSRDPLVNLMRASALMLSTSLTQAVKLWKRKKKRRQPVQWTNDCTRTLLPMHHCASVKFESTEAATKQGKRFFFRLLLSPFLIERDIFPLHSHKTLPPYGWEWWASSSPMYFYY